MTGGRQSACRGMRELGDRGALISSIGGCLVVTRSAWPCAFDHETHSVRYFPPGRRTIPLLTYNAATNTSGGRQLLLGRVTIWSICLPC